jgi:predicted extracellular nuclease
VVTRSGGTSGSVSADWAVQLSGSAEADDLAGPLAGSVTLADGETSGTIEIAVAGDLAIEGDEGFTVSLTPGAIGEAAIADGQATGTIIDDDLPLTEISAIQGATHTSTFAGERVTTSGIVTAVDSNGFYLQDQTGDGDVATSEAIFVFTGSAPTVAAGDEARVTGTVSEYVPGGASSANLSLTQLTAPQVTVLSSGNALPSAVVLGVDRIAPTEIIEDDNFGSFDPATDGIDFYESLEGMLVAVRNPLVVAPTNNFGEIWTVANDGAGATNLSDRGTMVIEGEGGVLGRTDEGPGSDYNPERIQIDDDANLTPGGTPDVIVGAKLADITGVVSYSFGNYEVIATSAITVETASTLTPETTTINGDGENLTVASYNVLNLDPNDGDGDTDVANGQFALIAEQIVYSLNAPDIVALQEVQDNSGSASDGTVSASVTLQMLADAIEAEGGPSYMVVDNPFIGDNTNGGQPGGNIRTAYLYNPERVDLIESSVRTIEGDGQQTDPSNPFYNARLPLVATFVFNEAELTLVNNHFSSKGGSSPLYGSTQDALNGSAEERFAQAEAVADFVTSEEALVDGVVVLGDLNEFQFEDPLDPLYDAGLLNLMNTLPEEERYSYLFEGNAQALDEFFVSEALSGAEFDVVHANAEFGHEGASDHDPLLASFFIPLPNDAPEAVDDAVTTARKRPVEIDVLANDGDADGDLLTIVGLSDPAKGSAELDADGTLTYTPDKDFKRGSDTFEYTIADGAGGFDTGSVTVTIDNTGPKDDMLPVTNYKVDLFGPAGFLAEGEHGQSAAALAAMEAAGWVSHGSIDPVEGFLNGLRGQSSIGYLPEDLALFV